MNATDCIMKLKKEYGFTIDVIIDSAVLTPPNRSFLMFFYPDKEDKKEIWLEIIGNYNKSSTDNLDLYDVQPVLVEDINFETVFSKKMLFLTANEEVVIHDEIV
jgi:hypothetical protein